MTKKLLAGILLLAASCNAPSSESTALADTAAKASAAHDYGVTASYSTDFSIGDVKYGDMIVKLWKDFDANALDNSRSVFADTVQSMFPGFHIRASLDSTMAMAKADRAMMDSVTTTIDAIVPLKASNKNETVVCIWGKEHAWVKGKEQSRDLHEVWGINENGKVTWVKQYTHALPK